tara:strand:+ start:3101 stop:3880 length:780 start_codon:yes stop_codon:yes gene_type:complete
VITNKEKKDLLKLVLELGLEAEKIKNGDISVEIKCDHSPLSSADTLVNNELNSFLTKTSYKKIISEENKTVDYDVRKKWDFFWMIDPIDGTKEFIKKGSDYTLNIALCKKDKPIFSIVYAPARNELYYAEKGKGAYKNEKKILCKKHIGKKLRIVASKSHLSHETAVIIDELNKTHDVRLLQYGSSLKICKIADGSADIYPRLAPTMEWDTCPAHLILNESLGSLQSQNNYELKYNKSNLINPHFIAFANGFSEILPRW